MTHHSASSADEVWWLIKSSN